MKNFKKAFAFLTVFLMIFGNGFFSFPIAFAATDGVNGNEWTDLINVFGGIDGLYVAKYDHSDFTYLLQGTDTFEKNSNINMNYDALGKPYISYVVIKAGSDNNENSGGGYLVYQFGPGGGTQTAPVYKTATATGSYTVTVTYNADGYPRITATTASAPGVSHAYFCVDYVPTGSIQVKKTFTGAHYDVNQIFTLNITGPVNRTVTLKASDDWVTVSGLPYGAYTISEADPSGIGYDFVSITKEGAGITGFSIDGSSVQQILVTNAKKHGSIKVTKAFLPAGSGPAGLLTFELYKNGTATGITNTINWPVQTFCTFDNLPYGNTYQVKELTSLFGFSSSLWVISGDIIIDSPLEEITCTNTQLLGSLRITKMVDGGAGPGTLFSITVANAGGTVIDTHDYAAGESRLIPNLPYGDYTVSEGVVGSGYRFVDINGDTGADRSITVPVASTTAEVGVIVNNQKLGGIVIDKRDANTNALLSGATFHIEGPGIVEGDYVTGQTGHPAGKLVFDNLTPGDSYTVTEVGAPGGYNIRSSADVTKVVPVGSSATFTFLDDPLGSLLIHKTNAFNGIAIQDVQFELSLYDDFHTLIALPNGGKTDVNGNIVVKDLQPGTYWVREIAANSPVGYVYVAAGKSAEVSYGTQAEANFANTPWQKIRILKSDGFINLLDGAVFGIYTKSGDVYTEIGRMTTGALPGDEDRGIATSGELPYTPGMVYYIKEITPPDGYGILYTGYTPVPYLTAGLTVVLPFANHRLGSITITKAMLDGITTTPVFGFTMTGPNGFSESFSLQLDPLHPELASKTFNNLEYGQYIITENILTGANYRLVSFNSVEFGLKTTNPYSVFIGGLGAAAGESVQSVISRIPLHVDVTVTDQLLGKFILKKVDAANILTYLDNAEFLVSIDPEFTAGPGTFTLKTVGGAADSGWLIPGTYYVKETVAPAGYHNDNPGVREIVVAAGETNIGETTVFTDRQDVGSLLVQKYSSYRTGEAPTPVAGVTFQLLTKDPQTGVYTVVDSKITGANGQVVFTGLPTGNVYYVRESQQAPGYDIDRNLVLGPYTVPFAEQISAEFVNNPVGQIRLWKYDASTVVGDNYANATRLAGAVYGIYTNANATGDPIATLTSTVAGEVLSAELPFGGNNPPTYYVKEITPPTGYLANSEIVAVTFTKPGEITDVRAKDVRNIGSLVIKKVDALDITKTLAGAEFTLYYDAALKVQVGTAITTGVDGIARFDNLVPGIYYLKETKAPKDYDILAVALTVTVTAGVTTPDPLVITNQYNPPEDIQTGMMDYNILLLGALAFLCGILLVTFTRKRRTATK